MASSLNGTGVTFSNGSTQSVAWPGNTGTVTSVATGNGLQGGTITSSGTLSIAAPGFNTVGSYVTGYVYVIAGLSSAASVAAGSGTGQVQSYTGSTLQNNLSGTWRWMGASVAANPCGATGVGVYCRIA